MSKEDIRRYTTVELRKMQAEGKSRTDWAKADVMTDKELERLVSEDPDEQGFEADWSKARLVMPKAKKAVSLRLDPDVVDWFKTQGKGYQTRINAVLRSFMDAQKK